MAARTLDWRDELGRWLKPFLARLGHKARRQMCPLYVSGLIGPGDRKSVQPMAKRLALGACDQLHHFIAAGVWDAGPLETELLVQADKLVGGSDAVLVIDDTAIPKKGTHSVGVAAQYASALGKTANCQTLVSLTLARGEVPVVLALRLFLPESWTRERTRLERAGVPAEYRTARTKPELALVEIDRVIAAGVHFGCVLADAGYGLSAPFRQALTARKLALGGRHSAAPEGLLCRRADGLAGCQARSAASAARPRRSIDTGRRHAGPCQMAHHQLAYRHQGKAQGAFCCGSRASRRRTTAADQGQGATASPRGRGLARRRTPCVGGEKILCSPTCRRRPTCAPWRQPSRHDGFASRLISN